MIRALLTLLVAILLGNTSSFAAGDRSYLSAGLGRTFLHKPEAAKKYVDNGYNCSMGVGFDFARQLSMHVTGEYHWGSVRASSGTWLQSSRTIKAKCAFLWLKLRPFTFSATLDPHLLAGVGYVYADRSRSAGATTYGIGVDFWVSSSIGVFIEGRHVKAYFHEGDVEGRPLKIGLIYLLRQ